MGQTRFTLRNTMLVITAFPSCFALFGVSVGRHVWGLPP